MKTLIAIKKKNNWEIEVNETRTIIMTDIDIDALCQLFDIKNPQVSKEDNKIIVKGE